MTVEVRPGLPERLERSAADEAQLRIPQGRNRSRARAAVNHRELADDRAGPEYREDTLAPGRHCDAYLEQAFFNPVAPVTLIPRHEQGLIGLDRERARRGKQ